MNPALLLASPLLAVLSPAQPMPDPAAQQTSQQIPLDQLDFSNDDTRMTVPVTIGPGGPYRFVVDTGSERTVIARELAETLRLAPGHTVRITAMAGSASVGTFLIPDIGVGTAGRGARITGARIEAPALVQRHLGAQGLVGIDTLQGHAVTIDFVRQAMTVTPSSKRWRIEQFGPDDIVVRAKNLLGQLVVTDASYRGRRIRVVIDTGSVVSMGNLALRRLVARDAGPMTPVRLLSVTGGVLEADYTQVKQIRMGKVAFSNLAIAFSDAPPFARLGLRDMPALLLGIDALRLFERVRIDFANRELRLAPPKEARPL